jgi:carboxyl-terminal processing protease
MKQKTILILVLAVACACCGYAPALAPVAPETESIYSRAGRIVSYEVPYRHLNHLPCNDDIATNALAIFIKSLDFDRTFFLASDIERFESQATELDDRIKTGDLDIAYEIYETLMERVSNRVEYVSVLLEQGFDLDREETWHWRRKDQPWAANEDEWNEIWRKKVKNQYVAKLVAKQLEAEESVQQEPAPESDETPDDPPPANDQDDETPQASAELPDQAIEDTTTVLVATAKVTLPPAAEDNPDRPGATNDVPDKTTSVSTNGIVPPTELTPEESIIKEYKQYLSVLNDNDAHWLIPLYISSFVHAYDPHSDYMSQNNTEDFDISMKLSLVGIGALLSTEDGAAKVVRLIPGGPAEQDGRLQPGDKIIAVGQGDEEPVDILHWPLSKSVRLIRGEKDTKVVLHIIPASDFSGTTIKKIDIVRDEVKLEERAAKGRVETLATPEGEEYAVGVITIPDFYADINAKNNQEARSLTRDVKNIIADLTASNQIQGLLLDLRNNGGGSLPEAIDLSGLFIGSGPIVQVKTEDNVYTLADTDPVTYYDGPLVILVNRQSASASEIFAGALQDYGRAVLVGDSKTHGKGTVQSLFPLRQYNPKLGSLKLTTASYYRIAGGSTQKKGITPDIIIPSIMDSMEIGEEFLPGALEWSVVDPAIYTPSEQIAPLIPRLQQRSLERREQSERFNAYEELLDYLAEKRQSYTIPLQLEKRLPMARRENEMAEFIANVDPEDPEMTTALKPEVSVDVEGIIDATEKSLLPATEVAAPDTAQAPDEEPPAQDREQPVDQPETAAPADEEEKPNDLILDEALNVLLDLIALERETKIAPDNS